MSPDPNRALLELSSSFAQEFQRWVGAAGCDGLSYPRMRILEALHCQGPSKLKSLADLVGMSARNLTVLADALEADGLARRVDHPTDRRVTLLELTPKGVAAAEDSLTPRLEHLGQIFDRLSPTERGQFENSLRVVVDEITTLTCGN